jgi:hypothetical protein
MVHRTLVRDGVGERTPPAGLVVDLIWVHARTDDRLEHVRAVTSADRVDLVLFIDAPTGDGGDGADRAADRVCRKALAASATFSGWRLHLNP